MTESSESKKRNNASSKKNAFFKKGDKFLKLDDSNHVAIQRDIKRAEANGDPKPTFKPRAPHKPTKEKKKCAENKSN